MKVAICFSGSIRDFPTCLPSLRRYVLDNLNADIFLHLWKMDDISNLSTDFKWRNDYCQEQYVIDQLKPVSYIIDKYSDIWEKKILSESGIILPKDEKSRNYAINACGMYYKIQQCLRLVEASNKEYDLIIRARLDFIWEDNIFLSDFNNIDDKTIFLVKDRYATHSKFLNNDKFFAGSPSVMRKMCNLFDYIKEYQLALAMVEGQTLQKLHIQRLSLKVTWIGHAYTYYKCMERHRIVNNNKYIIIGSGYPKLFFELAYYLLYHGYNIIYLNPPPSNSILTTFANFQIYNDKFDVYRATCLIADAYNSNFAIHQIIINNDQDFKNTTTIMTYNIPDNELMNFIISIISTKQYGGYYNFTDTKEINDIDIGEPVIFRYLDHGYYTTRIISYEKSKKKYKIAHGKEILLTSRENIKIINLLKYYSHDNYIPK